MGGNAFKTLLSNATFPRMNPSVYNALKAKCLPILQSLYAHAAVSPEGPGKTSYGDLDIIVTGPREGLTHEQVKDALRATCSVPAEGHRTSNFAVPLGAFEDVAVAHQKAAAASVNAVGDAMDIDAETQTFFQVDVNVCADHAQWERTVFYSSLGDLGFFLGLFAHTAGLSFNIYGMRVRPPFTPSPEYRMPHRVSMFWWLAACGTHPHLPRTGVLRIHLHGRHPLFLRALHGPLEAGFRDRSRHFRMARHLPLCPPPRRALPLPHVPGRGEGAHQGAPNA